jgi:hypothetical protein
MIDDSQLAESVERLEHCESLPGVLAVVAKVNSDMGPDGITGMTTEQMPRLEEWLGKLVMKLRELYIHSGGANSNSVTVGTHITVSVTFPVN